MERRLPPHAKRTLQVLWRAVEQSEHDHRQGLPRDHARRIVNDTLSGEDEDISEGEIDYHLEFLQNCGEIYAVDDWIRITAPEAVMSNCSEAELNDADESGAR